MLLSISADLTNLFRFSRLTTPNINSLASGSKDFFIIIIYLNLICLNQN